MADFGGKPEKAALKEVEKAASLPGRAAERHLRFDPSREGSSFEPDSPKEGISAKRRSDKKPDRTPPPGSRSPASPGIGVAGWRACDRRSSPSAEGSRMTVGERCTRTLGAAAARASHRFRV